MTNDREVLFLAHRRNLEVILARADGGHWQIKREGKVIIEGAGSDLPRIKAELEGIEIPPFEWQGEEDAPFLMWRNRRYEVYLDDQGWHWSTWRTVSGGVYTSAERAKESAEAWIVDNPE